MTPEEYQTFHNFRQELTHKCALFTAVLFNTDSITRCVDGDGKECYAIGSAMIYYCPFCGAKL